MLKDCWLTLSLRPRCNTSQLSMPAKLVNFAFWKALTSSAHNRVNVEGSVPIIKPVTQKCEMHGNEVPIMLHKVYLVYVCSHWKLTISYQLGVQLAVVFFRLTWLRQMMMISSWKTILLRRMQLRNKEPCLKCKSLTQFTAIELRDRFSMLPPPRRG